MRHCVGRLCTIRFGSRSHDTVIRVYDDAGNVIETHEHKGDFKNAKDISTVECVDIFDALEVKDSSTRELTNNCCL
jgi:hypothetical protein